MAGRRPLIAFLGALVVAATSAGWIGTLARTWRQGEPPVEQIAMGAAGVPLLLVSIAVLSRILFLSRKARGKGEVNVQHRARS